jgi:hypothetical protein
VQIQNVSVDSYSILVNRNQGIFINEADAIVFTVGGGDFMPIL